MNAMHIIQHIKAYRASLGVLLVALAIGGCEGVTVEQFKQAIIGPTATPAPSELKQPQDQKIGERSAGERARTESTDESERRRLETLDRIVWTADAAVTTPQSREWKHNDWVYAVAFSPDGRLALTGSLDETARLWSVETGALVQKLPHGGIVLAVAFSPDGGLLLTGSNLTYLWSVATGSPVRTWMEVGEVRAVAFSPDGRYFLTGSGEISARKVWRGEMDAVSETRNGTARLWSAKTGKLVHEWRHNRMVKAVAFSPDGKLVLTGSLDNSARLWSVDTAELLHEWRHASNVNAVAFSPDGRLALTGSDDAMAILRSVDTGAKVRTFRHSFGVNAVAFSSDGRFVLTGSGSNEEGSEGGSVRLWSVETGSLVREWQDGKAISAVAFSPDGRVALTGSLDGVARLWPVEMMATTGDSFEKVAELVERRMADAVADHAGSMPQAPGTLVQDAYENRAAFDTRVKATREKYRQALEAWNARVADFPNWRYNGIVEQTFREVFGRPLVADTIYNPETGRFFADIASDSIYAKSFGRRVALEQAIPNAEAQAFDEALQKASPVVEFAYDEGRFSWAGAHISVGGRDYAAVPVDDAVMVATVETTARAVVAPPDPGVAAEAVRVKYAEDPEIRELQEEIERAEREKRREAEIADLRARLGGLQAGTRRSFDDDLPKLVEAIPKAPTDPHTHLFAVGVNDYDEVPDVPFAERSAKLMVQLLQRRFGIPDENAVLLVEDKATGTRIKDRLSLLMNRLQPGDKVYLYYAGHGVPARDGKSLYMLPRDGTIRTYEEPAFNFGKLLARLSASPAARIIAFADTCFSGRANADQLVFKGVAPVILTTKERQYDAAKVTLFLAGGENQFANQYEEKGHRLFTYHLIRGLAEGRVEPDKLHSYVAKRVSQYSRRLGITYTQQPVLEGNKKGRL